MGFWIFIGFLIVIGIASQIINQLKQNNELLREIIKKMNNKTDIESVG